MHFVRSLVLLCLLVTAAHAKGPKFDAAAQHLVGTYSTVDGSTQMVVDRFSTPPRMQRVGEKEVYQITLLERSARGAGWDAYLPDGTWVFYMDARGTITANKVTIDRVGDAKPLKKITTAGLYVKPPTSHEVAFAALEPLSVLKMMEGYTPQGSGDIRRVKAAFEAATKDMWVHFVWSHEGGAVYRPVSGLIDMTDHGGGGYYPTEATYDPKASGAAAHGVVIEGEAWYDGRVRIIGTTPKDYDKDLAAGTNGLIWSVDGATVVFVAEDGGRYTTSISGSELEEGGGHPFVAGRSDKGPRGLQHTRLDGDDLKLLAMAKFVEESVITSLDEHDTAFRECAKGVFDSGAGALKKIAAGNAEYSAKQARSKEKVAELETTVQTQCKEHIDAYEDALLKQIDARNAAREALR